MAAFLHLSYLGAWQAHYDLKDPKGLAGFLIDSDIKLVRAESGSPGEWSRHKSQGDMRNEMGCKMKTRQSFHIADKGESFFSVCCFIFFTAPVGVVSTSVGLYSQNKLEACFEKQEDTESTSWAVLPGTSGACWMLMVVSLGGRKLKPRPSLMLLGHHVPHW